jgi:hypothetical protein
MQTLEKDEDPLKVPGVDPQSVVTHGKDPFMSAVFRCGDVYLRDFGTAVFDCVSDEVLKYLSQLGFVRLDGWQRIVRYKRTTLLDRYS